MYGFTLDDDKKKKKAGDSSSGFGFGLDKQTETSKAIDARSQQQNKPAAKSQPKPQQPQKNFFENIMSGVSDFLSGTGTTQKKNEVKQNPRLTKPGQLDLSGTTIAGQSAQPTVTKDSIKRQQQAHEAQKRSPVNFFVAGVGDVEKTLGAAASWLGATGVGTRLAKEGALNQSFAVDDLGEFDWPMLYNPQFYLTRGVRTIPLSLALLPTAIIGAEAGVGIAGAVGLGALGRFILGSIGGAALSRPIESALEAGQTYDEMRQKGKTAEEAHSAANKTFMGNLGLSSLDAIEFATAFMPNPVKATSKRYLRALARAGMITATAGVEGGEELIQYGIQQTAKGEKVDLNSPEAKESFSLGGIMGGTLGVTGAIYEKIQGDIFSRIPETSQKVAEFIASGEPMEQARKKALDEIVEEKPAEVQDIVDENLEKAVPLPVNEPQQEIKKESVSLAPADVKESEKPFFKHLDENLDNLVAEYKKKFSDKNNPKVIINNADNAKELFREAGYNDLNVEDVQRAAGKLTEKIYDSLIESEKGKRNNTILGTIGGTGSGKSSTSLKILEQKDDPASNYAFINDSTGSQMKYLEREVQTALDNGYQYDLMYVWRDPIEAWDNGVLNRKRHVSVSSHLNTHEKARDNFIAMIKKYADNPNFQAYAYKNETNKEPVEITVEDLGKITYNKDELKEKIYEATERHREAKDKEFLTDERYDTISKELDRKPVQKSDQPSQQEPSKDDLKPQKPKDQKFDYQSTQLDLPKIGADKIIEFGDKIPENLLSKDPSDNYKAAQTGREYEPHVTVLYGLSNELTAEQLKNALKDVPPIEIALGKTSIFENEKYDVLKVDIVSDQLHKVNKLLQDKFDTPGQTFKDYKPHATIAYMKKGEASKYAGDTSLEGIKLTFDSLTFSTNKGEKIKIELAETQEDEDGGGYDSGHPWYYKLNGKRLSPEEIKQEAIDKVNSMSPEKIKEELMFWTLRKFSDKAVDSLEIKTQNDLKERTGRYMEIVKNGMKAITDPNPDEMTLYTALSLTHNHVYNSYYILALIEKYRGSDIIEPNENTGSGDNKAGVSEPVPASTGEPKASGSDNQNNAGLPVQGKPKDGGVRDDDIGARPTTPTSRTERIENIQAKTPASRYSINKQAEAIIDSKQNSLDPSEYTDAEKEILKKYSGYGGISKEEGRGALDEFYTPSKAVRFVWQKLIDLGIKPEVIIEPSVGTGRFITYSPFSHDKFTGYEINKYSAAIAKVLHPDADIQFKNFQELFMDGRTPKDVIEPVADLVIGNPPYGEYMGLYKGMGEGKEFKSFEEYFIERGLRLTKEYGHVAYIVQSSFLRGAKTRGKEIIGSLGRLEVAYRLPNNIFKESGTDIGTDLVIFTKGGKTDPEFMSNDKHFSAYPKQILGKEVEKSGRFGMEKYVEGSLDNIPASKYDIATEKKEPAQKKPEQITEKKQIESHKKLKGIYIHHKETKIKTMQISDISNLSAIELEGYKNLTTDGSLSKEFVDKLSTDEKLKHFSFREGKWYPDKMYIDAQNLYKLLDALDSDKDVLTQEQYKKQFDYIKQNLPIWTNIADIKIDPRHRMFEEIQIEDTQAYRGRTSSVQSLFISALYNFPSSMFEGLSKENVVGYITDSNIKSETSDQKRFIQNNRARVANKLFTEFLKRIDESYPGAKEIIETAYNTKYNAYKALSHEYVPITQPLNSTWNGREWELNKAQREAVGFFLSRGKGIGALDVGVGKTLTAIIAIHESFNRGWASRGIIVVPNPSIGKQWIKTMTEILPEAHIYDALDTSKLEKMRGTKMRDRSVLMVTADGHEKIGLKMQSIAGIEVEISEAMQGVDLTTRQKAKEGEKASEMIGTALGGTWEDLTYETLGIDLLTIDEAHNYNHIIGKVPSGAKQGEKKLNPYSGMQMNPSSRGIKSYVMGKYILKNNNGRNVFLMTATPFTNHPLEHYSMLSFVADKELKERGVYNVREFIQSFMQMENQLVITPSGIPAERQVVNNFSNFDAYQQILKSAMLKIDGDEAGVIRPERVDKDIIVKTSEIQYDFANKLSGAYVELTELIKKESDKEKKKQLAGRRLSIMGALVANSFSPYATRFYKGVKPTAKEYVENTPKLKLVAEMIKANKRIQPEANSIVHIPFVQNETAGIFHHQLFKEYLVKEVGFKPEQVEIITGQTSKKKRLDIQNAFNKGDIKILLGTDAIAEGLDLQVKTSDIFITSPFWNYTDFRQMAGRAWRQGNMWKKVRINRLMSEGTADVFVTQKIKEKEVRDNLINQAVKEGRVVKEMDGDSLDFEGVLSTLLTDPVQKVSIKKVEEEKKLLSDIANYDGQIQYAQKLLDPQTTQEIKEMIADNESSVARYKKQLESYKEELGKLTDKNGYRAQYLETEISSYQGYISKAKGRIRTDTLRLEKIAETIKREGLTQESLTQLREKLAEKQAIQRALKEKYDALLEVAKQEKAGLKWSPPDYTEEISRRSEENKTFFEKRDEKPVAKKRSTKARASYEASPLGAYEQLKAEPVTEDFKLFEETKKLVRKYAERIGEGYTPKNALGSYHPESKNIRINGMNSFTVATHETAHYIDDRYKISEAIYKTTGKTVDDKPIYDPATKKIRTEMTNLYEKYYPGGKRDHAVPIRMMEGFATLVQKYIEMPTTISAEFPIIYREFLTSQGKYYNQAIGDFMNDSRAVVDKYQSLSSLDKIGARVVNKAMSTDKSFLNFFEQVRTFAEDEVYPIEKVGIVAGTEWSAEDPSLWMRQYARGGGIYANNILNKKSGYWTLDVNGEAVKVFDYNWSNLVDALEKTKQVDSFGYYLVARDQMREWGELDTLSANFERLQQSVAEEGDEKAASMKNDQGVSLVDEMKQAEKELGAQQAYLDKNGFVRAEIEAAYEENKQRFITEERMYDALVREDLKLMHNPLIGFVNDEKFLQLTAKEGYASMKRDVFDDILGDEDKFIGGGGRMALKISSLKGRTGGEQQIINPLFNGMVNHVEIIKKSFKQIVYNKIGQIAINGTAPAIFQAVDVRSYKDDTGRIIFPQEKDEKIVMARIDYKRTPVLVDKQIKATIDEVLTYQSMNIFEHFLVASSRLFTIGTTGAYAPFSLVNFAADQWNATYNTRNNYKPVVDQVKILGRIILSKKGNMPQYWREWQVMGGDRMTLFQAQMQSMDEAVEYITQERKGLQKVIDLLDKGIDIASIPSSYSETVSRFTEYMKAREAGKPQIVALEEAGRITAPFHHIGAWKFGDKRSGKFFVKSVPFCNATIQVLAQTIRTAETPAGKQRLAFTILAASALFFTSFAMVALMGSDDQKEQYKGLKPSDLATFLYFPSITGTGEGLTRIRISQEFTTIGTIMNMILGENFLGAKYSPEEYISAATEWMPRQANIFAPVEMFFSLLPPIIKIPTQVFGNFKDYPRIMPIENQGLQNKEVGQRFNESTSMFAKWLGNFNISPIKADYLIEGLLGRAAGLLTGKPNVYKTNPVNRDYFFTMDRRIDHFYKKKEDLEQKRKTLKDKWDGKDDIPDSVYNEAVELKNKIDLYGEVADYIKEYRGLPDSDKNRMKRAREFIINKLEALPY